MLKSQKLSDSDAVHLLESLNLSNNGVTLSPANTSHTLHIMVSRLHVQFMAGKWLRKKPSFFRFFKVQNVSFLVFLFFGEIIIIISSGFAKVTPVRSLEAPYKVKYGLNSTTNG